MSGCSLLRLIEDLANSDEHNSNQVWAYVSALRLAIRASAQQIAIIEPWLELHRDEIELAIQQNVPLDMVLKSTHTLSNEGA